MIWKRILITMLVPLLSSAMGITAPGELNPVVEVENEVYSYSPANNGAGPMWCMGNTSIVRHGDRVFAAGLETLADAPPLNNCVPLLFALENDTWRLVYRGEERTREPSPLGVFADGRLWLSENPTLTDPEHHGSGPARPRILQFNAEAVDEPYSVLHPTWDGEPGFTEHSYRSFAVDGPNHELVLFQNIGYTHAEWAFYADGTWPAQGRLAWPWGAQYDTPQPIRICYPTVQLHNRAVHLCGVSDIVEPYQAWREAKKEITGRDWDYDFRRLFYTWSDDITGGTFHDWVEVSSRDATAGWILPGDLYIAPDGDVHILWQERAIDERLREKFFPEARQSITLNHAVVRQGQVVSRRAVFEWHEGTPSLVPGWGRFHVGPDGRLFVFFYVSGTDAAGQNIAENRVVELLPDGEFGEAVRVPLEKPFTNLFTATVRGGSAPSQYLDIMGDHGSVIRYARVKLW